MFLPSCPSLCPELSFNISNFSTHSYHTLPSKMTSYFHSFFPESYSTQHARISFQIATLKEKISVIYRRSSENLRWNNVDEGMQQRVLYKRSVMPPVLIILYTHTPLSSVFTWSRYSHRITLVFLLLLILLNGLFISNPWMK